MLSELYAIVRLSGSLSVLVPGTAAVKDSACNQPLKRFHATGGGYRGGSPTAVQA